MRFRLAGLMFALALSPSWSWAAGDPARERELAKERGRFDRETDPVDRAKIGIKISELLLEDVGDAARDGEYAHMERQIEAYNSTIEAAHQTLIDSGRDAQRKGGGFRELEIALRKQVRRFEDLARLLNLDKRAPLEKAKSFAEAIQKRVFKALFP